jgi:hypothetical protein
MPLRPFWVAALASALAGTAACSRTADSNAAPAIALTTAGNGAPAYVEVTGLPATVVRGLQQAHLTPEQWGSVLRVAVSADSPPMLGDYTVTDRVIRFTPLFPFDQGRQYHVRFEPSAVPGGSADPGGVIEATVGRPASTAIPSTVVARVYPSGDVVPENLLRMYVEFSAPMGRKSGVEYITLLDHEGREIPGAVLPLDYEFWSPDHKRFTVFFDPGRVKKGILPNLQMGRPLEVGRSVTLVIKREWLDENGLPLKEDFRRALRVGPTDLDPLDTAAWRIHAPAAGSRDSVVVTFPEPLDHGLLLRALGVTRDGKEVEGAIAVDQAETRWTFTPATPWRAGTYHLLALDILEDLAGNQIGRAFEVDNFDTVDKGPNPQSVLIPFVVKSQLTSSR